MLTPNVPAAVQTAIDDFNATVDATVAQVGALQGAPLSALVPAQIAGFAMDQAFSTAIAANDAALPTEVLTFSADGALDPSTLTGAAQALADQSALILASAYFGCAVVNIETATG